MIDQRDELQEQLDKIKESSFCIDKGCTDKYLKKVRELHREVSNSALFSDLLDDNRAKLKRVEAQSEIYKDDLKKKTAQLEDAMAELILLRFELDYNRRRPANTT